MHGSIGWPMMNNVIRMGKENHTFGMVRRRFNGSKKPHQGWDFYAKPGYRCYSVADGVVLKTGFSPGYGRQIIVKFRFDLGNGAGEQDLYAFYGHLSRIDVVQGQKVRKGQQLGLTGNSGNAISMRGFNQHLHFEIRTSFRVRRGLKDRLSPMVIFGHCPKHEAAIESGPFFRLHK